MNMKIFLPPWMPELRVRGQKIRHAEAQVNEVDCTVIVCNTI